MVVNGQITTGSSTVHQTTHDAQAAAFISRTEVIPVEKLEKIALVVENIKWRVCITSKTDQWFK